MRDSWNSSTRDPISQPQALPWVCAVCGVGAAETDSICGAKAAGLNVLEELCSVMFVSLLHPESVAAAPVSKAGKGEVLAGYCCRLVSTAAGSMPKKVKASHHQFCIILSAAACLHRLSGVYNFIGCYLSEAAFRRVYIRSMLGGMESVVICLNICFTLKLVSIDHFSILHSSFWIQALVVWDFSALKLEYQDRNGEQSDRWPTKRFKANTPIQ